MKMIFDKKLRRFGLAGLISCMMSGCFSDSGNQQTNSDAVSQRAITLASIANQPIYQHEIESRIALKLYDLEWAKYELKREALAALISEKLAEGAKAGRQQHVEVLIEPPMPPRIDTLDAGSAESRTGLLKVLESQPHQGRLDAPVIISVFCNYQSLHCARMAKVYSELSALYEEGLAFVFFDSPQKFHRYSGIAAQAARCADAFDQLPAYQSALWASQDDLKQTRLVQHAKQLGIETQSFERCLNDKKTLEAVKQNMSFAESLDLNKVPITLVNGLYLNGPKSVDTLRYFVDKELERVNRLQMQSGKQSDKQIPSVDEGKLKLVDRTETPSTESIPKSALPLRYEGVSQSLFPVAYGQTQEKTAQIRKLEQQSTAAYHEDDEVLPGVFVVLIEDERLVIENQGKLEYLDLASTDQQLVLNSDSQQDLLIDAANSEHDSAYNDMAVSDEANLLAENENSSDAELLPPRSTYSAIPEDVLEQDLEYSPRPIVESKGVLPLSKYWVTQQLQQQSALATGFQSAAHEVEGKHLLKLRDIADSEFYQTLGLKEGDAVMRVNGEWVHEQHNNLFEVLENEDHLSIVLMRKGLPVHLEYAIR